MALVDDIRTLRNRALAELVAAHDYYTDTKIAWKIVQRLIKLGQKVTIRNRVTGTITQESHLAEKARSYVADDLAQATFQQFVAIFEHFFFDLLRLWLTAYSQSLSGKEILFETVLKAPDKESITLWSTRN